MKYKQNNGFTLVELLAVIVILAIILVIAVPKVMSIIEDAKKGTLESTAKMIASGAEKAKVQNTVLGNNKEITCDSVAKINKGDYASCSVEFENNTAKVTIEGKGKFEGLYVCEGTKTDAEATSDECEVLLSAINFESQMCKDETSCTSNNLIKDNDGNIRYYGANPNNYIEFNNEVWRIIGVFNVASEENGIPQKRLKIVRNENLNTEIAYDAGNSNVFIGSDVELYLNSNQEGGYYYSLNSNAKEQISKAVWNTGILDLTVQNTASEVYELEKNLGEVESIFGLINVSDYGFAGEKDCKVIVGGLGCIVNNWFKPNIEVNNYYYTIIGTSYSDMSHAVDNEGMKGNYIVSWDSGIRPSVYLNANISLTGTGVNTTEGIYKIG